MLTDEDMAIMQRGNTDELRALILSKDALINEKEKTIAWQRNIIDGDLKRGADAAEETKTLIEAHILPRQSDCQVDQKTLSQWLAKACVSTTVRQIQRWEQYLKTNGQKGTKPPDGYTLQTRLTTVGTQAWVTHYATIERGKLTTRNYFNEQTATRDRKPARSGKTKETT